MVDRVSACRVFSVMRASNRNVLNGPPPEVQAELDRLASEGHDAATFDRLYEERMKRWLAVEHSRMKRAMVRAKLGPDNGSRGYALARSFHLALINHLDREYREDGGFRAD